MKECPYCGEPAEVTGDPHVDGWTEVEHMQKHHPDVIVERFRSAGMHQEADKFEREARERTVPLAEVLTFVREYAEEFFYPPEENAFMKRFGRLP